MAKYILFDTETTGKEDEDRIIQIGSIILDSKADIEVFDELCSCDIPIKLEAMEVHNITPNLIQNKKRFVDTQFYSRLNELNNKENYLIAHNLNFDLKMLEKEGFNNKCNVIDTLKCSRHLIDSSNHRLQYLRYFLELYKDEESAAEKHNITIKAHSAIGDVLVMKLLLSKLTSIVKKQYPDTNPIKKLTELTIEPVFIEKFKFGKYKDYYIKDVCKKDMSYINWLLNNKDIDEDLKYSINKVIKTP